MGRRGRLERSGLRGELGFLLLVVERLRDLPPQRAQPLLPLRPQRLRHLSLPPPQTRTVERRARGLGFWVGEARQETEP
ncbi:hypothetical protein ABZP36_003056 [Zizania latifolia]